MATEKLLNTRIQLKYDTLANWNASSFKLKAGELAIVALGDHKDGTAAGTANQHPVLFKVGTGNHTFSELPFASALAADVYAWAKAAEVKRTGKTLQFVDAAGAVIKSVEFDYITDSEAQAKINAALAAYSTTAQMNAAIKVETDRATGVEGGLDTRLQAVETAIGENGSVATQINNAIKALDSSKSQTAGADGLALSVTLTDGKVTALSGSIAANTYDAYGAAAAAEGRAATDAKTKADNALAAAKTYAENQAAAAKTYAEEKATAAESAAKAHADQKAAAAQEAAEGKVTALANGQVKTNKEAIEAINNTTTGILAQAKADAKAKADQALVDAKKYADTAEADALAAAKAYTDEVKAGILGEGITETFDTLVEIQNWINGAGVNATELSEAIAAEAKLRGDEDTRLAGLISAEEAARKAADKGLQDQIDALGIADGKVASAKKADVASSLDAAAVAQVEGIKVNNATNADIANSLTNAAKAEVKAVKVDNAAHADNADKLGNVVAANYALKTDAQGYADAAEAAAATDATSKANAAQAAAIATAATDATSKANAAQAAAEATAAADATDKANKALADAKAYANGLAGNYATAAQGAKADSALQSIEAGTGLKVSTKADNKQTVEIDTGVVFVFNCGSASTLID